MKATETRVQEVKSPKTVQVKMLVPYGIIVIAIVAVTGLITGWTLRSDDMNRVQAEAHEMVTSLSKEQGR